MEIVWWPLKKLTIELSNDTVILLKYVSGPYDVNIQRDNSISIFIVALFNTTKVCN